MFVDFVLKYRRIVIICLHLFLIVASNLAAFALRFDGEVPREYWSMIGTTLPGIVLIRLIAFHFCGVHHGLWRYTSIKDLKQIVIAVTLSSAGIALMIYPAMSLTFYPRSILIIDSCLLIMSAGGIRLGVRLFRERSGLELKEKKPVFIYGAGDAGELLLRDILNCRGLDYQIVGFLDDDSRKMGLKIHGVPVLGSGIDLGLLVPKYQPKEVIIAIPSARPAQVRMIMETCRMHDLPLKTLPSLKDVISGDVSVHQIRDISLEDLLFRDPVRVDLEHIRDLICGKRVMVTGAAGSIGSELCRQILRHNPRHLILYDRSENGLYYMDRELGEKYSRDFFKIIVGDVGDTHRLCLKFQKHQPQIVFHAAAYKHVPLMEENVVESVKNNVVGTRNLMELADQFGVETFVLISTDKAVNPTSVMGVSKRIAEMAVKTMNQTSSTRFLCVRFGNVLGSSGSVVPLFKDQIRKGGPVTVTHPDIQRYFMTIPEAVQLVLQAVSMGDGGEVFVLDMGEQVKIVELARTMITLSGLIPEQDIKIEFSGLRPGEKLYEELYGEDEMVLQTAHKKIFKALDTDAKGGVVDPDLMMEHLLELEILAMGGHQEKVLFKLKEIVPSYNPPSVLT